MMSPRAGRLLVALGSLLSSLSLSCELDTPPPALAPVAEPGKAFAEVVANLRAEDGVDGAYVRGKYRYYTRHDENGQRVWCRTALYGGGAEEVLLMEKDVGGGSLGSLEVSPDDKWVAFSSRPMSVDRYAVQIKDRRTGEIVAPVVNGADFSVAWGDDDTLFYSKLDKKDRPAQVYALKPHSRRLPKLIHEVKGQKEEVMVGADNQGPALFVRSDSDLLAYRLNPLYGIDGPGLEAPAVPAPPVHARAAPMDAGSGGGSLDGAGADPAAHRPAVR